MKGKPWKAVVGGRSGLEETDLEVVK